MGNLYFVRMKGGLFMKKRNVFVLGALLGAAAVALLTPKSGKEMQNELLQKVDDIQTKIKDLEVEDVKEAFVTKLDEIKELVNNFDWELSKADLEVKVNDVKAKLNEMVQRLDEAKETLKDQAELVQDDLEENFTIVIDAVKDNAKDLVDGVKTVVSSVSDDAKVVAGESLEGTKTGYGELEGFFGGGRAAGSALGVYYNDFSANDATRGGQADDLWGAYASLNLGKWNALANYENVSYAKDIKTANGNDDSANVWIGKLTYGKAGFATPKSWDAWVEYINAEDGAFIGGSTNSWRFGQMDNIESWGVGADYTFAKNAMFQVMQSFGTNTKDGNAKDPEEQTRAQFVFVF